MRFVEDFSGKNYTTKWNNGKIMLFPTLIDEVKYKDVTIISKFAFSINYFERKMYCF